ncbi:DUF6615 family protein [Priestia aryabhattai]|uniref:DUF6615 family protein n=1 Tax=Priestia aryabhattai TaxID=412384 RepID=UPI00203E197C|nr:DUF6615 family protein [Priestia aryabhattai]MCM3255583.1 hypothetical protein [Priestia aryabhattai]
MSLSKTIRDITHFLYWYLKRANQAKATMGEETITDLLSIELKTILPSVSGMSTSYVQCNKNTEKKTGSDFLWYIYSTKTKKYVGLYVQAKKSPHDNGKCDLSHNYKTGVTIGSFSSKRQVDNLIYKAKNAKAIPLYCVYNCLDKHYISSTNQPPYLSAQGWPKNLTEPKEFSFTYVNAKNVQSLLNQPMKHQKTKTRRTFDFEEIKEMPFYSLFSNQDSKNPNRDITKTIIENATIMSEGLDKDQYLLDSLPEEFKKLLKGGQKYVQTLDNSTKKSLPTHVLLTETDQEFSKDISKDISEEFTEDISEEQSQEDSYLRFLIDYWIYYCLK